jgi:hypothetical protein
MTLRPVNNPAAGSAQWTRTDRHVSRMSRRDLAFVYLQACKVGTGQQLGHPAW